MSENPTNRERSCHVDVRVHFLRDMVRDGAVQQRTNDPNAVYSWLGITYIHKH